MEDWPGLAGAPGGLDQASGGLARILKAWPGLRKAWLGRMQWRPGLGLEGGTYRWKDVETDRKTYIATQYSFYVL